MSEVELRMVALVLSIFDVVFQVLVWVSCVVLRKYVCKQVWLCFLSVAARMVLRSIVFRLVQMFGIRGRFWFGSLCILCFG